MRLGDILEQAEVEVVPTGFPSLDAALGIGGLPRGRISEIFGPDSSGKQALVARLVVQCQKADGVAAYVDLDRRLDPEQMRVQGVDFHSLLVVRPNAGATGGYAGAASGYVGATGRSPLLQALEMAIRLARSGGIRVLIFDGAGEQAPGTSNQAQGTRHKAQELITYHSSLITLALRRLVSAVDKNGIAFVFLNTQHPTPITHHPSPIAQRSRGGQALRFFASVRLAMERREWIRRGREVIGCRSLVQVVKNKLAAPLREAEVDLIFYHFPPDAPLLQLCQPDQERSAGSPALSLEPRMLRVGG